MLGAGGGCAHFHPVFLRGRYRQLENPRNYMGAASGLQRHCFYESPHSALDQRRGFRLENQGIVPAESILGFMCHDALRRRQRTGSEPVGLYLCRKRPWYFQNIGRFGRADGVCGPDGAFQIILRQIGASHSFGPVYDCQQRPVYFILSWHLSSGSSSAKPDCLRTLRLVGRHYVAGHFQQSVIRIAKGRDGHVRTACPCRRSGLFGRPNAGWDDL